MKEKIDILEELKKLCEETQEKMLKAEKAKDLVTLKALGKNFLRQIKEGKYVEKVDNEQSGE